MWTNAPQPKAVICGPACGTVEIRVTAGEYLRENWKLPVCRTKGAKALSIMFCGALTPRTSCGVRSAKDDTARPTKNEERQNAFTL